MCHPTMRCMITARVCMSSIIFIHGRAQERGDVQWDIPLGMSTMRKKRKWEHGALVHLPSSRESVSGMVGADNSFSASA